MENFNYSEEIRDGYTISTEMKKIWAVELDLYNEFKRVCGKYNLRYFAFCGTLLGAIRHNGFVPWDDDMDICMLRDDYAKFIEVAPTEFNGKYCFQDWFNSNGHTWMFSKLRNSETTAIEWPDATPDFNQGIFIDIYPLDEFYEEGVTNPIFKSLQIELFHCINNPTFILNGIKEGNTYTMDTDSLLELCKDYIQAQTIFGEITLENYNQSNYIGFLPEEMLNIDRRFPKDFFDKTIDMPFENTTIPVPSEYDAILTAYYGDYMTPVQGGSNHVGIILDPEKPYKQWLAEHQSQ